jgi:hypothetical protein
MSRIPCFVEVTTFLAVDPDTVETTRTIDHNDSLHRAWLEKHMHWALRNGRGVEVTGASQ